MINWKKMTPFLKNRINMIQKLKNIRMTARLHREQNRTMNSVTARE